MQMYPEDLLYYYNKKFWYSIPVSLIYRVSSTSDDFFTIGKWRNATLTMPELPKLWKPFVKWEGKEDPEWDFDVFITEAHTYFQGHPEEQISLKAKIK